MQDEIHRGPSHTVFASTRKLSPYNQRAGESSPLFCKPWKALKETARAESEMLADDNAKASDHYVLDRNESWKKGTAH